VFAALLDPWEEVVDVVFRWVFSLRVCGMMQVKKEGIDTVTKKQPNAENDGYFKITVKTVLKYKHHESFPNEAYLDLQQT
jgi:hypothetical protein